MSHSDRFAPLWSALVNSVLGKGRHTTETQRRAVFDRQFDTIDEPLRQLLTGALAAPPASFADLVDKVRILCSVYDPVTGKYRVNYAMYIEIAGGITFILFMIAFVINEWRARRALRMRAG